MTYYILSDMVFDVHVILHRIILFYNVFIVILQKEKNLLHDVYIYLTKFVVMTFKAQNKLPYYVIYVDI